VSDDFDFSKEYLELLDFIAEQMAINDTAKDTKHEPENR